MRGADVPVTRTRLQGLGTEGGTKSPERGARYRAMGSFRWGFTGTGGASENGEGSPGTGAMGTFPRGFTGTGESSGNWEWCLGTGAMGSFRWGFTGTGGASGNEGGPGTGAMGTFPWGFTGAAMQNTEESPVPGGDTPGCVPGTGVQGGVTVSIPHAPGMGTGGVPVCGSSPGGVSRCLLIEPGPSPEADVTGGNRR